MRVRVVLGVARHALLPEFGGPRCERQTVFEVLSDVREVREWRIGSGIEIRNHRTAKPSARRLAALPGSREIDFPVSQTRRRCVEIRHAIRRSRRLLANKGGPLSVHARRDRGRKGAHKQETSHYSSRTSLPIQKNCDRRYIFVRGDDQDSLAVWGNIVACV